MLFEVTCSILGDGYDLAVAKYVPQPAVLTVSQVGLHSAQWAGVGVYPVIPMLSPTRDAVSCTQCCLGSVFTSRQSARNRTRRGRRWRRCTTDSARTTIA